MIKRKLISLLLAASILIAAAPAASAYTQEQKDAADELYTLGLFYGTDKGFELDRSLTRQEAAAMVVRLVGKETTALNGTYRTDFTDVALWAEGYVGYAQTAGQQTYQGYLQNINEMLPQYYEMALNRYNSEDDALLNQYGLLSDREDSDYSRYTDRVNRYYSDLDRYRNAYDNERSFDYGQYRDQVSDDESARQLAQQQVDYLISLGANVPDDLLAASGYNSGYLASINQLRAEQAAAAAAAQRAASSSGSGGGKEPVGGVKKIDPVLEQDDAMALYTTVIESGGTPQAGIQELVKAGASLTSAKSIANSYQRKHFG